MVGKTIDLNGLPFEVIGIVSLDDANFLQNGVFVPYTVQPLLDRTHNELSNVRLPVAEHHGAIGPWTFKSRSASRIDHHLAPTGPRLTRVFADSN